VPDLSTLAFFVVFAVVVGFGLYRSSRYPLDRLRRRRTKDLLVDVDEQSVHRGEEVEALVTISSLHELGDPEVGLVCTEFYDEESTDDDGHTHRTTCNAIAHEIWVPIERAPGVQNVRLAVPAEAPFSYEGGALSFRWEVVARGRKEHQLDAQASKGFSVLP
jgi:hypothetical protein